MDVLELSRLQFAVTSMFHFIFVPLTLGLSVLVAFMETRFVRTGDPQYLRMTKFWGKLFLINFALGIVTGIPMEFQFGMNWAEYSRYVGDIFGAPLAIEATVAFFLESTFIGLWIFGWDRVSKKVHALSIWLVALATNLSALWILLANGWMQHPVGYVLRNGRAEMVDFGALLTNPYGIIKFFHTLFSGYVIAAFFVMGIAAWHLLRNSETAFFARSFRIAARFGFVSALLVFAAGDFHAVEIARVQPAKFAAMESVWETQRAAPYYLLQVPDEKNERNAITAAGIPGMLSLLAHHEVNAVVTGLKEFPREDRPPVLPTFLGFRGMAALGMLFVLLSFISVVLSLHNTIADHHLFLRIMLYALPLPYIAGQMGWIVAEVGRQPWLVYGVFRTSAGVSLSLTPVDVWISLAGFTLVYGVLAAVDLYLLITTARKGPDHQPAVIISPGATEQEHGA